MMITPELIARINELSRKKRAEGLNQQELDEQAELRRIYLDSIKAQVRDMLDTIEFVDPASSSQHAFHQTQIDLVERPLH